MFRLISESHPTRCEICHQSDLFLPEQNQCLRCLTDLRTQSSELQSPSKPGGKIPFHPVHPPGLLPSAFQVGTTLGALFLAAYPVAITTSLYLGDVAFHFGLSPFWGSLGSLGCTWVSYELFTRIAVFFRRRQINQLTSDEKTGSEIRAIIHDSIQRQKLDLVTLLLLQLRLRGEDIQPEMKLILELLTADFLCNRLEGWWIFCVVYTQEGHKLYDYNPRDAVDICTAKVHKAFPELTLKNKTEVQKED